MVGLLAGVDVADFGSFAATSRTLETVAISDGTLIDELRIVATGANRSIPRWDNFVFDPVAAPPAAVADPDRAGGRGARRIVIERPSTPAAEAP